MTEFEWFAGFAKSQQQKSIRSLHENAKKRYEFMNILEISSKSEIELGISLSAFNLKLNGFSVECIYQSSKKFTNGGPYKDILQMTAKQAKRDIRIKNSGKIVSYNYNNIEWELEPTTAFYDYIYIKALLENNMIEKIRKYDGFTDIAFNPKKSQNCQARSCAVSQADEIVATVIKNDINKYLKLHAYTVQE